MKLHFDNKSFDIAISKNIEFVLGLTEAIAREHWDEVRNNLKCTYNNFFEMLAKSAAQAFRKAYFVHFDDIDAKDDDSFKVLIEKFVGGQLLDHIHDIIHREKEKPRKPLGKFGMGIKVNQLPANYLLDEEDDEYWVKIEGVLIEIKIQGKGRRNYMQFIFHGDHSEKRNFEVATGARVKMDDEFDDESDLLLIFSEFGIS